MNLEQALAALEDVGTAQNRKVYGRHGVSGDMFGVSYANLEKLRKQIKKNHDLAVALWVTGNHDAKVLATKIADPKQLSASDLDDWSRALGDYVITDAFSAMAAKSPHAAEKIDAWAGADDEWVAAASWTMLSSVLVGKKHSYETAVLEAKLATIEAEIHGRENRVRYAMNNALIAIALVDGDLQAKATAAAERIGAVEVDHGETGCKTPEAVSYIANAVARRDAMAARRAEKAAAKAAAKA